MSRRKPLTFSFLKTRYGVWLKFNRRLRVDGNRKDPIEIDHELQSPTMENAIVLCYVLGHMPETAREWLANYRTPAPWEELVLEHGKEYPVLDTDPGHFSEVFQSRKLKPWRCYENSARMAREEGLGYAEGIAVSPAGAMLHAWNVKDGQVVDHTWPAMKFNRYFGVEFDMGKLIENGRPDGCILPFHKPDPP